MPTSIQRVSGNRDEAEARVSSLSSGSLFRRLSWVGHVRLGETTAQPAVHRRSIDAGMRSLFLLSFSIPLARFYRSRHGHQELAVTVITGICSYRHHSRPRCPMAGTWQAAIVTWRSRTSAAGWAKLSASAAVGSSLLLCSKARGMQVADRSICFLQHSQATFDPRRPWRSS
jgi:hypothetical protein